MRYITRATVPVLLYLGAILGARAAQLLSVPVILVAGILTLAVQFLLLEVRHIRQGRQITGAIHRLTEDGRIDLATEIAQRDVQDHGVLQISRETDRLTAALNAIIIDVMAAARKFSLFSTDIFYSGEHLAGISDDQAQLMKTVLDHTRSFQEDLEGLQQSIHQALGQIEETADHYQGLRRRAEDASGELTPLEAVVNQAESLARDSQQHMHQSLEATASLQEEIASLNARLSQMEGQLSEVGVLLTSLQSIADTTHVLATNASIVAARAGASGKGFAVIAGEVRSLAGDSREVIRRVEHFLTTMTGEIHASAAGASAGTARIADLTTHVTQTDESLKAITAAAEAIRTAMESFRHLFDQQNGAILETLQQSEEVHRRVEALGSDINRHAGEYTGVRSLVDKASTGAVTAAHAARVLSQLGTYLRTGGQELSHVVDQFDVSEDRLLAGVTRKEPRTTLLYNLEVFRNGELLGYLGNISPSGLLLLTSEELPVGEPVHATIHLPLSSGNLPDVPITFVPRRMEQKKAYFHVGCSIDEHSSSRQREDIAMIITNYTVTHGMESIAQETADGAMPGQPVEIEEIDMISGADEMNDVEEVEELEEL